MPVTTLLREWTDGSTEALEQLTPLVYAELRRLARRQMRGENAGHLLQTTALVHEAYLRLVGLDLHWQGRDHFFAICARLMRRVLVDLARSQRSLKRGGSLPHLELDETLLAHRGPAPEILQLNDALDALARIDERKVRVVELRLFAGLTIEETGSVLGISHATVERDLKMAKAWLTRELDPGFQPASTSHETGQETHG